MRTGVLTLAATTLLFIFSGSLAIASPQPMQAQYMLFSESSLGDPLPGEKKTSVGIYIKGDAAWDIYQAMDVPAKKGTDCEEGMLVKRAGNFVCYLSDTCYCEVGVILRSGKTTFASTC